MASSPKLRIARLASHVAASGAAQMLAGQVAVITGSGQGIGAAAAELFAEHGAAVVICDIDASKAEQMVSKIKSNGGRAVASPGDVMDPSYPERCVKAAVDAFGKINILVNNAGFTWDGTVHKMGDDQWDTMLRCHITAPFRMVRAAASCFRNGDGENKVIINISSTSGLHGNAGQANYSAAKSGILGFTKTIAKEWGHLGVRCNAVAFGFIDTRLTQSKGNSSMEVGGKKVVLGIPEGMRDMAAALIPMQRHGTPEEAAGGILILASPYASYISGHCLEVTGGAGI